MTMCHGGRLRKRQLGELGLTDKVSYSLGKKNGSLGGKLLGAGSSGFVLFVVPPEKRGKFVQIMKKKYKIIEFNFDDEGSKVIYEY